MKSLMTFIATFLLLTLTPSAPRAEINGDRDSEIKMCQYYHNGDFYKAKLIYQGSCPLINPPTGDNEIVHTIVGDLPKSDPRWNEALDIINVMQKIDNHDCIIIVNFDHV